VNFKSYLATEKLKPTLEKIVKIFKEKLPHYTDLYEVKPYFFGTNGVTIQFWRSEKHPKSHYGVPAQTASIKVEDHEGKFDLHLSDIYIPDEVRNKGYLTEALTEIRKIQEMSGRCKVHVAVNPAWRKIIERAGFEWL
jgi:hypothetical protein